MANDVALRLKAVRQMHGLSQRELAKRAGVTNGMISLIEQGRVSPSVASLKKVLDSQRAYAGKVVPLRLTAYPDYNLAAKYYWPDKK